MPKGSSAALRVAGCAGAAAFFYQFENCLTTTALPVMSGDVTNLAGVIALVPAAYLVAALMAMVPAGRLAVRLGHRRVLAVAVAVMAAGALVCGFSSSVAVLLIGRALEGIGGGAMASAAYGLVATGVPANERQGVMGWISLGAGLGMVAGTPLGGLVAATVSWRALFVLQVPLLLVAAFAVRRMDFERDRSISPAVSLGFARSVVVGAGAGCACLAGCLGRDRGWWSPEIVALLLAAIGLLGGFVWSEQRARAPLFPADVWRARGFWPYWALLGTCAAALGAAFFLTPFYLHEVAGMPVPTAARWMIIEVAAYALAAGNARRLQALLAAESQALVGVMIAAGGVLLFAADAFRIAGPAGLALACALTGGGLGLAFPAVNAGCVARLPAAHRGLGAALLPLGLNLGSMVGTIASAEVREWRLVVDSAAGVDPHAFLVVLAFLVIAGAGFWREAHRPSSA